MIAQSYKNELDRVAISDEDIEYLQQNVSMVLDLLVGMQFLTLIMKMKQFKKKRELKSMQ